MIITLLFTALAAFASEPDAAVVTRVLEANDKVHMNSCNCEAPYVAASTDRSDANMCSVIAALASGNPKLFDTKNPYGLCAPEWKVPTPEWQRPEVQAELQTYATSDFVPLPRDEYLRLRSRTLLNETARANLLKQTNDIRESSARACCGSDKKCLETMRAVRVSICSSPADQDPTLPDPCEATGGSYNLTAEDNSAIVLSTKLSLSVGLQPIAIGRAIDEANATFRGREYLLKFPAEGEIRLSPYGNANGSPISELGTLRHEFGHACSFIRRQIAATPGAKHAEANAMSLFQRMGMPCALESGRQEIAYGPLLTSAGADRNVELCLLDLARQSTVPESAAYIPNSCPVNKIEEATAEAFAFYTLPLTPDAFPQRACSRRPSKFHPASVDVLSCVIKADAKKRRELSSKYRCQGVR